MTPPTQKRILTMNKGSATLKSDLYDAGHREDLLLSISVDQAGVTGSRLKIADPSGATLLESPVASGDHTTALTTMFAWLAEHGFLARLAAVGHRLVHGGPKYKDPQRVTPDFLAEIKKLVPLDPDHLPAAIEGIEFIAAKFPDLPQVACFDTAFHRTLPTVARMYALPRRLYDNGIVRYGFHGLSY
ncbi:MAG: hypothetical protein WBF06_05115, partial [Candidatus Acidiferrales bacterium]